MTGSERTLRNFLLAPVGRLPSGPLRQKLVLLGTLVTLLAVGGAFTILSVEIRRQTRAQLRDLLARNQETVINLQKRSASELLWTSRLMTEGPTLRAAMETYQTEVAAAHGTRPDLLETIQAELDRTRTLLGRDLAVITDAGGTVLAVSPAGTPLASASHPFGAYACVQQVLRPGFPTEASSFAVLPVGEIHYRVGCVPITLQDFVIGTLSLGERLDGRFLEDLHRSLRSDTLLVLDNRVLESTLSTVPAGEAAPDGLARFDSPADATGVVRIGREEYVAASLSLGVDPQGRPARLILVQSFTRAVAWAERSLLLAVVVCGVLASLLAGLAAWRISRSVLRPLERFVAFMGSAADSNDHSKRFEESEGCSEIHTLNQTYNRLMDSLQERERQILQHGRDEVARVERLKESEKLASLGRMLAGAAHEINNPLTGVVGNLELLLRAPDAPEAMRVRLERVQKEARRIVGLVRSLLKVAHRDTGQRTPVDLHQLLTETAELRQHDFSAAGLELRLEFPPGEMRVEANAQELQQVFLNLINNAYDALRERARDPVLSIRTERAEGEVAVVFEDGGPGMKDPGKVFDHFYTTKEVGKGTGLGLSISHAIVQGHGGRIRAENREEGGARFVVVLPAKAARSTPDSRRPAPKAVAGVFPTPSRVLVVEDEPAILELQTMMLESMGATAVGVRTGAEAIAALRRESFDLIVSDLRMPGEISGQELYRWVERNRPECAARMLFVTGDTARESTRQFLERSGRRHLTKPFSVNEYAEALRETLAALPPAA